MARWRFAAVALLALTLAGNSTQSGRSAGQNGWGSSRPRYDAPVPRADDCSCVIYSLAKMGYDTDLGQWIAETIPAMVEPSSWQGSGGSGTLRYYGPKNILIINNSAAVRAKVDSFLKDLKTSLPPASPTRSAASKKSPASVVPAVYDAPDPLLTHRPVPEPSSYPVPAPVKLPKHLFHFIIRYEGEGLIDDNVVRFLKAWNQAEKQDKSGKAADAAPVTSGDPILYGSGVSTPAASTDSPAPSTTAERPDEGPKQKEDKKDDKKEKKN